MRRHPKASPTRSHKTNGRGALGLTCICLLALAAIAGPVSVAAAEPPPGRAYELVSPAAKESGATALSTRGMAMPGRAADVGERVVYGMSASVEDSSSATPNTLVFGERTATGWRARTAVRSTDGGNTQLGVSIGEPRSAWLTRDGREIAFGTVGMPLGGADFGGAIAAQVYRSFDGDAPPAWLSLPTGGLAPTTGVSGSSVTAGGDARTVAFTSTQPLVPEAVGATKAVYAYRDGVLQVVSWLPGETLAPFADLANSAGSLNGSSAAARKKRNEVAGNGHFVLFAAGGSTQSSPLYVRDLDLNVTHQLAGGGNGKPDLAEVLSAAAGGPGIGTMTDGLVFAARDAGRAYFYGRLGEVQQMYEADLSTGTVTPRPAINGAPVQVSSDGQRMLFLTRPTAGVRQLRFWNAAEPDTSVLVGEIAGTDGGSGYVHVAETSDEGQTWIFSAVGSLDPDRVNVVPSTLQLYRWAVGDGAPTCLTCEPVDGAARSTGVNMSVQDGGRSETLLDPSKAVQPGDDVTLIAQPGHGLSKDGRWFLFDSPDRLVDADTNEVRDVYLWDRDGAPGGQLQLVTSGQGDTPSWALDLSPDGTNAFFSTREGLVPADFDGAYDVYSARIGEGFPARREISCVGEECRPPLISALPAVSGVGSDSLAGHGNFAEAASSPRPSVRVARLKPAVGPVARLRVWVPGAGRISVVGPGLRSAGRSVSKAGTYPIRVMLSSKTRETLAKRKRLAVQARVSYRAKSGQRASKATRVVFEQSISKRAKTRKGSR